MWVAKQVNGVEWAEARAGLDAEQHRLESDLRALPMTGPDRVPAAILADWAAMTLDEQRAVIADYIEKVIIVRACPGLQRFDSDRVKIKWREPSQA